MQKYTQLHVLVEKAIRVSCMSVHVLSHQECMQCVLCVLYVKV